MSEPETAKDDTPAKSTPPPSRSWRMRWSMRAFFALVTVACLFFAWGSYQARVGQTHDEVAEQLAIIGASHPTFYFRSSRVDVKWKYSVTVTKQNVSSRNWNIYTSSPTNIVLQQSELKGVPPWMETTGTGNVFQRIQRISLYGPLPLEELDQFVQQVCRLDRIEALELDYGRGEPKPTQAQLAKILSNIELQELDAERSDLRASSFPELKQTQLERLNFSHTWFSDSAVADLPTSLKVLDLERTAVTDAALPQFTRLRQLESLDLERTPTSEAAVESLRSKMPWCEIYWAPLVNP